MIQKRTGLKTANTECDSTERFVSLITAHQHRLRAYAYTLIPHDADVEEVLQETNIVLWRKFHEFRTGTDFMKWATKVAYFEILKLRRRRGKEWILFSDEVLQEISEETEKMSCELEEQCQNLATCLGKLSEKDRQLVALRYDGTNSVRNVAQSLGRSVEGVYKSLQRIRHTLLHCVQRLNSGD